MNSNYHHMGRHSTARGHSSNTNSAEKVRNNCTNAKHHTEARQDLEIRDRINEPCFLKTKKGKKYSPLLQVDLG